MLKDKLAELTKAIDAKEAEARAAWAKFDEARTALRDSDVDLSDPEAPEIVALDETHKPYSKAADELAVMKGQRERIQMMDLDSNGDLPGSDVRRENDLDRADAGDLKALAISIGERAVKSDAYDELVKSGALVEGSEIPVGRVELASPGSTEEFAKALGRGSAAGSLKSLLTGTADASGAVLNVPERFPGIAELPQLPFGVMDLVTVGQTSQSAVEFVRILARTANAAEVTEASTHLDMNPVGGPTQTGADAGLKPESGVTFQEALEGVRTIAHWIPATRNMLADAPMLRTIVESELLNGVERRAENQIVNGSGTAPNIRGIVNTPGIVSVTQGTAPSAAGDEEIDAVHRLLTQIRLGGFNPTAVGFNPLDWENIRLAKDGNENYIWGPPSLAGVMQVWGVPAVSSVAFAEDTAVAGEWARALFLVREAARVFVTDSHKDWFVRNLLALLAEARGVLVIIHPAAFGEVTFTA